MEVWIRVCCARTARAFLRGWRQRTVCVRLAQVILKPDPGRPQELYLGSLAALGIDTRAHDIRFVEDNWENPTLGAWGLGWEVWMDGAR